MTAADIQALFQLQYQASRAQADVPLLLRRERLLRMQKLLEENAVPLAAAVQADFGVRSERLTEVADLMLLRSQLAQLLRKLARWMRPQRVMTPLQLLPARAWVQRQPLGVVGVISPWNYPLQLSLGPVIAALAAGNRVMLKPSELTPLTSELLARLIAQFFAADELSVVLGDSMVAGKFSTMPFDHLFFTGSTAVGRKVAQAAALNLTPTTLELGGKSPCILAPDCDVDVAALRIAHGKLLNAGQTCIAPDYVLLPAGREQAFADAFGRAVAQMFPRIKGNPDYASIINPRQQARLRLLLQDAQAQGAHVQVVDPRDGQVVKPSDIAPDVTMAGMDRQMAPVLVFGATDSMKLMDEEIFGPVLPVLSYGRLDDAINHINARPRPLALYWFGHDAQARNDVLQRTVSGGVSLNDTLMHVAHDNLPFGGVGDSGWGSYHGEAGFLRFSHQKAVFAQSKWNMTAWLYPPYGQRFDRVLRLLRRWA